MKNLLSSSAIAAPLAIALPVWAQTAVPSAMGPATFDGIYAGSLTSTSGTGFSSEGGSNRSKCWTSAPAKMTVRGGYMVMEYPDWKRHILHYRGIVDQSGTVSLRHTNSWKHSELERPDQQQSGDWYHEARAVPLGSNSCQAIATKIKEGFGMRSGADTARCDPSLTASALGR